MESVWELELTQVLIHVKKVCGCATYAWVWRRVYRFCSVLRSELESWLFFLDHHFLHLVDLQEHGDQF